MRVVEDVATVVPLFFGVERLEEKVAGEGGCEPSDERGENVMPKVVELAGHDHWAEGARGVGPAAGQGPPMKTRRGKSKPDGHGTS